MPSRNKQNWLIIANPSAGNGAVGRALSKIEKLLSVYGFEFELTKTRRPGDGIALARAGIENGFRKIIAIGGDGTNNEVINGIMAQQTIPANGITYSLFPIGTGNDWIKTHGIPRDLGKCLQILKEEKTILQDIGWVSYCKDSHRQRRYFANMAGMAYDAFLVKHTVERNGIFNNKYFYLLLLLKYLFRYQPQKARIQFDGEELIDYVYTINAGIGRFAGGGMEIAPHAVPDDGKIALTIARKLSRFRVLLNTYRFYNGSIAQLKEVSTHLVQSIRIDSLDKYPILVEADGEFLGETPVEFGIVPKALKVLVP